MEKTTGGKGNVSLKLADRGLFEGAGRGGKRQLGAASILLELPNEVHLVLIPPPHYVTV